MVARSRQWSNTAIRSAACLTGQITHGKWEVLLGGRAERRYRTDTSTFRQAGSDHFVARRIYVGFVKKIG